MFKALAVKTAAASPELTALFEQLSAIPALKAQMQGDTLVLGIFCGEASTALQKAKWQLVGVPGTFQYQLKSKNTFILLRSGKGSTTTVELTDASKVNPKQTAFLSTVKAIFGGTKVSLVLATLSANWSGKGDAARKAAIAMIGKAEAAGFKAQGGVSKDSPDGNGGRASYSYLHADGTVLRYGVDSQYTLSLQGKR